MKNFRNILWGITFVVIGIILSLNILEITDIDLFFDGWWTLFLIVPCFIDLFKEENKTGNIIGLIIGIILFLACNDIVNFEIAWKLLFPIILIIIGLSCIFKNILFSNITKKIKKKNEKEYIATFSEQKVNFQDEIFKGCDVSAVFGAVGLDLTEAIIKQDVVINASAIFGSVDIYIPHDVKVKVSSTSIFGGTENKTKNSSKSQKTIYINTTSLFGGIEIK